MFGHKTTCKHGISFIYSIDTELTVIKKHILRTELHVQFNQIVNALDDFKFFLTKFCSKVINMCSQFQSNNIVTIKKISHFSSVSLD
jgi:hypothetical protein